MSVEAEFLDYSAKKLDQMCERVEACMAKLTPEQAWHRGSENENAAGNLVLHLTGNVRQWILTGIGGEPNTRDRDAEFAARGEGEQRDLGRIARDLRVAVDAALELLGKLPRERLMERVEIQQHRVTVLEAIYHVVEHFSGHTGQIIFITKAYSGQDLGFYSYLSQPGAAAGKTP